MSFKSWFLKHVNSLLVQYIDNLDPRHFSLAITSGQLVLNNLVIKPSVINELLPAVQVVHGCIGRLKIVFPSFVHFSTSIWEIEITDLFILLEPNPQEEYNEEKENKKIQAEKQKQLTKIESIRKQIREGVKKERFKPITGLLEKFIMMIIKNVVVNIRGVHVRFEDKTTHPECPIAVGMTLSHILVESNKDKFVSVGATAGAVEDVPKAFKVVTIQSIAIYWNYYSKLYRDLKPELLVEQLRDEIATTQYKPKNYTYILEPIFSLAKLKLNLRPDKDENPFVIPKVTVYWEMPPLEISISKEQYRDAIGLADAMAFMVRGKPYRKFRPNVPYKGHYKEWWHFAYNCILESQVRRKFNNFNWNHISGHLRMCKEYGELYKLKLQSKKLSPYIEKDIAKLEEGLDLMNIVLVRQKILTELEIAAKNRGKLADRLKDRFSRSNKEDKQPKMFDIVAMIRTMTPAEKDLFYQEIDYNENIPDTTQPKDYTDIVATFALKKFILKLHNNNHIVLLTQLSDIFVNLAIRTSANAGSLTGKIKEILVTGVKQGTYKEPTLISNNSTEDGSLCDVSFAMNPLNSNFMYKLHIFLRPIHIIFDAVTINTIVDFVTIPRSSTLQQLSNVASSTINKVKFQSSAKLQYVIDNHSQIDLTIDVWAPYVIIPFGGHYTGTQSVIAINLGHALFLSIDVTRSTIKEKQQKYTQQKLVKALIEESYDKFMLKFTDFQVIIVPGGKNWLTILKKSPKTVYHILYPLTLNLEVDICMVEFDPRLPRVKLNGVLPSLSLNITDYQLVFILGLINSIPSSQKEETSAIKESQYRRPSSHTFNVSYKEVKLAIKDIEETKKEVIRHPQHTSLEVYFVLNEISVNLKHQEYPRSPGEDVARICLELLSLTFKDQTYAQELNLELQNLMLNSYHKNYEVPIIVTPKTFLNDRVFEINFLKADEKSPDFATIYKSTEILLSVEIEVVKVKLQQEILQNLVKYATGLEIHIEELHKKFKPSQLKTTLYVNQLKKSVSKMFSHTSQAHIHDNKPKIAIRGSDTPNIICQLKTSLQEFHVTLGSDLGDFTSLAVKGIMAEIILKKPYFQVSVILKTIDVKDLSLHTKYMQIIKVLSKEVINFNFFFYNKFFDTSRREDMAISVSVGQMQIVLLALYVTKVVDFVNIFTKTREAIIKVSKAAAVKAKQNVASIYENATQIVIKVDLKAPQVIIPEKSTSLYGLLFDLGHLTIKNEFLDFNIRNENTGSSVVVDETELKLSNVQVSVIQTNKKLEIRHSMTILKPFNFVLKFKRNLSGSWYKSIPNIQFKGYLKGIEIVLGQTEYGLAIATVLGNLSEVSQHSSVSSSEIKPIQERGLVNVKSKQIQSQTADNIEEVTIVVKFSLVMDNFTIKLFYTDDFLKNPRLLNAARNKLAQLSFEDLCIKGRMLSDDSIYASVALVDCVLKDTRIEKGDMLNKMFLKTYHADIDSANTSYKSMIDVIFQKKNDHIYVDLKVSEFTLILSMEFVLQLQTFLSTLLPEEFSPHPNTDTVVPEQSISRIKITTSTNQIQTEQVINATVNVMVEKPDIVLVENLDDINTNAIIINFEFLIKLCTSDNKKVINGLVKDIQMYTCCYNPTQREKTTHFVLFPFTLNIAGSTPEGKGLHIEICLTEIRIKISPTTTQLLNRVYSARFVMEQDSKKEDETFENMFDLWSPKPYNEKQYWFFNTSVTEDAIEYIRGGVYPISFEGKKYEMCIIRVARLVLTLETGELNAAMPILMLESCFEGNIRDWSADMAVDATITLQIAYYNSNFAAWEPLIEPNGTFHENVTIHQPWELKVDVSKYREDASSLPFTHHDGEIVLSGQPKMSVIVSSNTNLEVTISKTTLEMLTNLGQAFSDKIDLTTFKPPQLDNHPYKIINKSGLKVRIDFEKSKFSVYQQDGENEVIMEHGDEVNLQLKESDRDDYSLNEILGNLNIIDKRLYITARN
ncbi:intermembrane lipid transfer protein Vps13-like [Onthophagus taurus]|uniref:intermembrane lipid transfer protein Vps13-like n=1 Tax=Onthophagus taurus TaxID=166361 RepID=UPI0039BDEF34